MLSAAMQKRTDTMKKLMALRNADNQAEIDTIIIFNVWDGYNETKLEGINPFSGGLHVDVTHNFFAAIPTSLRLGFHNSTLNIIQFGISTGQHLTAKFKNPEKIIGYDYSPIAIAHIASKGIQSRLTDLNKINEANNLAYQHSLEMDLSTAAEILIIRTLECLTPQAADLLIHALINLCKPDSRIYIETHQEHSKPVMTIEPGRNIPTGYIPSFFAARTDFEFKLHKITHNERADRGEPGELSTVERLVVRKR